MGYRVLGQEVRVSITVGGVLAKTLTAIKSLDVTFKGEAVKSDYLGQPGPDFDEVADGVDLKLEFEVDDPGFFDLLARLIRRKQGLEIFQVNISARFQFRNGVTRLVVIPDVQFADIPMSVPERKQKVRGSLTGNAKVPSLPTGV